MTTINITAENITINSPLVGENGEVVSCVDLAPKFTKTIKATVGDKVQIKFPLDKMPLLKAESFEDLTYADGGSRAVQRIYAEARMYVYDNPGEDMDSISIDFNNAQFVDLNTTVGTIVEGFVVYEFAIAPMDEPSGTRVVNIYGTDSAEFTLV